MALSTALIHPLRFTYRLEPSKVQQLLRFSTVSCQRVEAIRSSTPHSSQTIPPPETLQGPRKSAPAFKPKHQRQTGRPPIAPSSTPKTHASPSAAATASEPSTSAESASPAAAPPPAGPPRYHVQRVLPSRQLPIYTVRKGHGTLLLTKVKKISGDRYALARDLKAHLGIELDKDCRINPTTGHLLVKGHWVKEVEQFLGAKGC